MKKQPVPTPEKLLSQYTPLVYHIVSASLTNPADIRECVNEVFSAFYENIDSFDPDKGTYASWLASIARHKAVSCYRKNLRREERLAPGMDPDTVSSPPGMEAATAGMDAADACMEDKIISKLDLEAALQKLDPEELTLIRQKYYNGMTIKEIAASMNLPYETVKKRHQRSIHKLRLMLLILLAIALLAGCGYFLARHLGILPGYGINTRENLTFYRMPEPVSVEIPGTDLTAVFSTAVYDGDMLLVRFRIYEADGSPYILTTTLSQDEEMDYSISYFYTASLNLDDRIIEGFRWGDIIHTENNLTDYFVYQPQFQDPELSAVFSSSDTVAISLTCNLTRNTVCSSKEKDEYGLPVESNESVEIYASFTAILPMERMSDEVLENYTYEYTEESGGVLAIPRLENGELIVELYPVQGQNGYVFPSITEHTWYQGTASEPEPGPITVTSRDGTVLTGTRIGAIDSDAIFFSEWNFGPAQPGSYTLNIPYLLKLYGDDKPIHFPIDITNCTVPDKTCRFDGGSFRITNIEPMTWDDVEAGGYTEKFIPEYYYNEDYEDEYLINPFSDADLIWRIDFETAMDMPEETLTNLTMLSATRDLSNTLLPDENFVFLAQLDYPDNGHLSYLLIWVEGSIYRNSKPYDDMYLCAGGSEYRAYTGTGAGYVVRWDHEFHLELNVE